MPFNLGPGELLIILAVALMVFGPKKLPEIGKGLGNALREFNKARNDFMDSLNAEPDRVEPARSSPAYAGSYADASAADAEPRSEGRSVEYPEPLEVERADALPYGSDFHAVEGDSQPSFRTAPPDTVTAANSTARSSEERG